MKLENLNCQNTNINIDEYIEFREMVKQHMEYPEWLGDFTKEDIVELIANGSKIWIYFINDEPVCSMMKLPSSQESLKKFELELNENEVVNYGPMFVNPKYVGNGLQYQMLQELDEYCRKLGFAYALGTIHPENYFSINNLIKDEFEKVGYKELKRGPRNIYVKNLIKK